MASRAWFIVGLALPACGAPFVDNVGTGDPHGDASAHDATDARITDAVVESDAAGEDAGDDALDDGADAPAFDAFDGFVCPPFPYGWVCDGVGTLSQPDQACIERGGSFFSVLEPVTSFCQPTGCTTSCGTCDFISLCKHEYDAGLISCRDDGGKVVVNCAP